MPYPTERIIAFAGQIYGELHFMLGERPGLIRSSVDLALMHWQETVAGYLQRYPERDPVLYRMAVEYLRDHFDEIGASNPQITNQRQLSDEYGITGDTPEERIASGLMRARLEVKSKKERN